MIVKTLYIEITNRCNLNCRTCYNRSGLNRETHEISLDELQQIVEHFRPYGLERVLLAGGEPTLHSDFDAFLDWMEQTSDLAFGIVTNGTVFNEKLIDFTRRCERLLVQISLDGSCEEINALTRGRGHFDQVMRFVNAIGDAATPPRLKTVLSQQNLDDVERYYALAVEKHCSPEFAFIYRCGNGEEHWDDKALTSQQKLQVVRRIEALNQQYGYEAHLPLCTYTCPLVKEDPDALSLCIKTDGSIQPCQSLYDARFTLGNARHFDDAAFHEAIHRLTALARQRKQGDFGCRTCLLQAGCGRGCMAAAFMLHGDPLADDGECVFRKAQFVRAHLMNAVL